MQAAETAQQCKLQSLNSYHALVLDLSYRPIDVVNWQRAICLDIYSKVDVLEYYDGVGVSSARDLFPLPAVVRVRMFLQKKPVNSMRVPLTRRNVLLRDKNACQYCGKTRDLSIDHIIPVSKGGKFTWENLVTACKSCNQKKGDKTLAQIGWKTLKPVKEPLKSEMGYAHAIGLQRETVPPKEWSYYIEPFLSSKQTALLADANAASGKAPR